MKKPASGGKALMWKNIVKKSHSDVVCLGFCETEGIQQDLLLEF